MNTLQDYFQLVLSRAEDIKTATLLMAGYAAGKNEVNASTFGSQTPNLPPSVSRPTSPEISNTGLSAPFGGVSNENPEIKTRGSYVLPDKKACNWGVLLLTEKELLKMPKKYRPDFRVGKIVAHVRQKDNGVYEIRCQIDKKQITASSKNLETAKMKFADALRAFEAGSLGSVGAGGSRSGTEQTPVPAPVVAPLPPVSASAVTLGEYMLKWLETVKKPNVKEITYKQYFVYYNAIIPVFGGRPLNEIKPFELQEFFNELVNTERASMAVNCKIMLNAMFEYAVIDDVIPKSPLKKITVPHVESKEGVPLAREEEKALVSLMLKKRNIRVQACVFMLYTGLRRSELASVELRDGWVHLICAKGRKGYKAKSRSVPVSPMLAPLLPYMDIEGIKNVNIATLSSSADKIIPNHHCHELRHTFITRCQECGIRREIVSLWAGHAADNSITSSVYTHLQTNKDIQLDEIKKFKYDL